MKGKKVISVLISLSLLFSIVAFSGCTEKLSDEGFMNALAKGLEARWELADAQNANDDTLTKSDWEGYINAEYNELESYKDYEFEDADLGKWAKEYINSIEDSLDCLDYFDTNQWDDKYGNDVYNDRVKALYKINAIKAIPVSDDNKAQLNEMVADGEVAEMAGKLLKKIKFKETKDEFGDTTCTAIVENTTSVTFDYFSFTVDLIDKDGVTLDTEEPSVSSWAPGEKVKFEFYSYEDYDTMEIKSASWSL